MEESKTKKGGVSAFEKRIQREMQEKGREKADRRRDQEYHNRGADMEICEFR